MTRPKAVLFDLDGTLLDTIPDLLFAINTLRQDHAMPHLTQEAVRPMISHGSKVMLKEMLNMEEGHDKFHATRQHFFNVYENHLADKTAFFAGIETVLNFLDQENIPWGVVTNKLTRHTEALFKALEFSHRPKCVICGDTLKTAKPDPAPILHACKLLKQDPAACWFVGDSLVDMQASNAAGTRSILALYGYVGSHEETATWNADEVLNTPTDLLQLLQSDA